MRCFELLAALMLPRRQRGFGSGLGRASTTLRSRCWTGRGPRAPRRDGTALAPAYVIDPALVAVIIRAESDYRTDAVSPKGAKGLISTGPR